VQGADNDIAQLQSNIHDAEEAMSTNAQAALQQTRERRLKAERGSGTGGFFGGGGAAGGYDTGRFLRSSPSRHAA
jgi:hypothetical protein